MGDLAEDKVIFVVRTVAILFYVVKAAFDKGVNRIAEFLERVQPGIAEECRNGPGVILVCDMDMFE